jgi:hypothetical protein
MTSISVWGVLNSEMGEARLVLELFVNLPCPTDAATSVVPATAFAAHWYGDAMKSSAIHN